MMIVYLYFI